MSNLNHYQPIIKKFNGIFRQVPDLQLDYDPITGSIKSDDNLLP